MSSAALTSRPLLLLPLLHLHPPLPPNLLPPLSPRPFLHLHTPLFPSASNISLGQRQLLTLARALLANPKILIMDEATSAVDPATDVIVHKTMRRKLQGYTLIVIAHRLSTVKDFDRIMVMHEGRSVEVGEPGELMKRQWGW
ncbi:MAG: hypothetical protein LQ350_002457 [Teloschistes chrysophthalmus]|nr:MAG: hypothetical protein LQ350_002457 [Niorma chrysophthalma]